MGCHPPSDFVPIEIASLFGLIAEHEIGLHFLDHVGRKTKGFFPGSPTNEDFQDISIGIGNVNLLRLYLMFHNRISAFKLVLLTTTLPFKIPDLITHDPPGPSGSAATRTEFYEIKPNSKAGLTAGHAKIAIFMALCKGFSLPYNPGTLWSPDKKILLAKGSPLGINIEVFFHFKRIAPGLIVYEICIEGDLIKLSLLVLLTIIALIIILILKKKRIPDNPLPIPDPPELPIPIPIPIPVPPVPVPG